MEWTLVQDRDTGRIVACEKEFARELDREGKRKIIAQKGERKYEQLSKLKVEGKL